MEGRTLQAREVPPTMEGETSEMASVNMTEEKHVQYYCVLQS